MNNSSSNKKEIINENSIPKDIEVEKYLKSTEIIKKNNEPMNDFFKNKYKNEAARNWDIFYKRNTVNFFKDRHWTDREFEELKDNGEKKKIIRGWMWCR